jgi:hypothetical protein
MRMAARKGVVERFEDALLDPLVAPQGNWATQVKWEKSQVVEAKEMVGMLVREEDGVDNADPLAEQLLPQVGRRIDEQIAFWKAQEGRTAGPLVVRVVALAHLARTSERRDTGARSRPQQDELPADVGSENVALHVQVADLQVEC